MDTSLILTDSNASTVYIHSLIYCQSRN